MLLIDTGNSYEGLCNLIHNRTHGEDGIYYTYSEEKPISFNPFLRTTVFSMSRKGLNKDAVTDALEIGG